eukprot:scaffold49025_cov36-Cyclotella_meneghiniana.AAC.1
MLLAADADSHNIWDYSSLKSDKTAGWGLNVLLRGDECGQFIVTGQAAEIQAGYSKPEEFIICCLTCLVMTPEGPVVETKSNRTACSVAERNTLKAVTLRLCVMFMLGFSLLT